MDSNANADVESMIAPQRVAIGILGPCLVAWCSQLFLSGICLSSFYHYARQGHFSRDTARIKLFVTTVVGLNVIMGFCSGVDIFRWGTTQERTSVQLWSQTIMDCLMPTMGSIAAFLVQGWFLRRTTLLFQRRRSAVFFSVLVFTGMVAALGGAIGTTYFNFVYASGVENDNLVRSYSIVESVWLWASAAVDVCVSGTLCYLLQAHVAGFSERTDSTLLKIMKLSIETASYTAVAASIAAIVSVSVNTASYFTGDINYVFWIPLPSLYTLSLLTTLESRDRLAKDLNDPPTTIKYGTNKAIELRARSQPRFNVTSPGTTEYVNIHINVAVKEDRRLDNEVEEEKQWRSSRDRKPHRVKELADEESAS